VLFLKAAGGLLILKWARISLTRHQGQFFAKSRVFMVALDRGPTSSSFFILNSRDLALTILTVRVSAKKGIESASRIVLMNVTSIRMCSHESDTVS
jgi:hypothetical protein